MDTRGNDLMSQSILKLPYGQLDHRTPAIIELANLMGRSANTVSIRLNNYSSCDPQIQDSGRTGMEGGRKQCQPYWDEFDRSSLLACYQRDARTSLAGAWGRTIGVNTSRVTSPSFASLQASARPYGTLARARTLKS